MQRRILLGGLALLPLLAPWARADVPPAVADPDIARVQAYLNGVTALHGRFLQTAQDGSVTRGGAWIERPGRMRFQYDPPDPLLLVAADGIVMFYDPQLQQVSNMPLSRTPLSILLAKDISFAGNVSVLGTNRLPGQFAVSLARAGAPNDGTVTLEFADTPLTLRGWTVVDAQRRTTHVSLYDVSFGGSFDSKLFSVVDPRFLQGMGGGNG